MTAPETVRSLAEAVAVHPGIAAERERWLRNRWLACDETPGPTCWCGQHIDADLPLSPEPVVVLLPAVPPAELMVGDVVLAPANPMAAEAVEIKEVEVESRASLGSLSTVTSVLLTGRALAVRYHWWQDGDRPLRVIREAQP